VVFFLGRDAVEGKVYAQLGSFVGHDTALQLQQIIKNASIGGKGKLQQSSVYSLY